MVTVGLQEQRLSMEQVLQESVKVHFVPKLMKQKHVGRLMA